MGYNEIMDEFHRIREEIYEETKDMTPEERVAWMHNETAGLIAELGLRRAGERAEVVSK